VRRPLARPERARSDGTGSAGIAARPQQVGWQPASERRTRGRGPSHLVASAIAQILIVVVLLVSLLVVAARNSSAVSETSRRSNTASSIAADLEAVALANVQLQSAFDRAVAVEPASARATQFSNASSTGIIGTGAFSTYRQRSVGLPHEAATRRAYEAATDAWNKLADSSARRS